MKIQIFRSRCLAGLFIFFGLVSGSKSGIHPGFRVIGRYLYDKCGEKVILRGVANPNIWFQKDGMPQFEEIEKTGANVIRIVWNTTGSAADLYAAILNCIDLSMIPMIECHDATCDLSLLDEVVDYWTRPEIVDVIIDHEEYLLLNIANEAGDYATTATAFRNAYETAILRLREADIHVPLVIDGPDCGKRIDVLQSEGPYLIGIDPDSNLIFSVHMWWNQRTGYPESLISQEIEQSVNMNLPLIVGEFGCWFDWDGTEVTPETTVPYQTIIEQCHINEIGYIAWSWFGNNTPILDMTTDGTYATLHDWGLEVAVTSEYSIQNTSVRPHYIDHVRCNSTGIHTSREKGIPELFTFTHNFPNPFNPRTQIDYRLSDTVHVRFDVFDEMDRYVVNLLDEQQTPGSHSIHWEGKDETGKQVPSGVYICRIEIMNDSHSVHRFQKMILVK
jgi:mannan endo-1,4-beta-mannosidase